MQAILRALKKRRNFNEPLTGMMFAYQFIASNNKNNNQTVRIKKNIPM